MKMEKWLTLLVKSKMMNKKNKSGEQDGLQTNDLEGWHVCRLWMMLRARSGRRSLPWQRQAPGTSCDSCWASSQGCLPLIWTQRNSCWESVSGGWNLSLQKNPSFKSSIFLFDSWQLVFWSGGLQTAWVCSFSGVWRTGDSDWRKGSVCFWRHGSVCLSKPHCTSGSGPRSVLFFVGCFSGTLNEWELWTVRCRPPLSAPVSFCPHSSFWQRWALCCLCVVVFLGGEGWGCCFCSHSRVSLVLFQFSQQGQPCAVSVLTAGLA